MERSKQDHTKSFCSFAVTCVQSAVCLAIPSSPELGHTLATSTDFGNLTGTKAGSRPGDAAKVPFLQQAVAQAVEVARQGVPLSKQGKDWADDLTSLQHLNSDVDLDAGLAALQNALHQNEQDVNRLNATYHKVTDAYRTGQFGRFTLDSLL